ncbi:methylated-DNA--[protein]-cysteine S-methyltransferase [Mesorhizobium marinum]|uniref:methylated-DNA--[protein]-cysteine S-methyltransferase n=1 Tax=Mesorhizobium marinum TaxID=3228790 RepID=UPI003466AA3B
MTPSQETAQEAALQTAGSMVVETALGFAGFAWSAAGLTRLYLFQHDRAAVERRLERLGAAPLAGGSAVPAWVAALADRIRAYAAGETVDFSSVPVDLAGIDDFRLAIYAATRRLGYGETTTYGELARLAGHAGLPRETGQAMGSNPVPLIIPCHRVLAAGGKVGGFSAPGGSIAKQRMLELEGVRVGPPPAPQQSFAF